MNIKRKPYSAKGAVLIMVLTVMFVLIFLLAGAVAVVYTSNNRVMMQYEESQAYYTARSVIDVYHGMILSDDDTTKVPGGMYFELGKDPSTGDPVVKPAVTISPGRALELDLYRVPVSTDVDPSSDNYNPYFAKYLRDYDISTSDTDKFNRAKKTRNLTHTDMNDWLGTNVDYYKSQFELEDSTVPSVVNTEEDDTLIYYVNYNNSTKESEFKQYQNKPTELGDVSPNKLIDNKSKVILKVQVLDRRYGIDATKLYDTSVTNPKYGELFFRSKREDDKFTIKVTSIVSYDGQEISTSVIYSSDLHDYTSPPDSKGIVSLSDINGKNSLVAVGGGSQLKRDAPGVTGQLNNLNTEGSLFLQSNLSTNNTDWKSYLAKNDVLFTRGELNVTNQGVLRKGFVETGATLYVNNGITISTNNNNGRIGDKDDSECLNIISPKFKVTQIPGGGSICGLGIFEDIDVSSYKMGAFGSDYVFYKNSNAASGKYYCNNFIVNQAAVTIDPMNVAKPKFNGNFDENSSVSKIVQDGAQVFVTEKIIVVDDSGNEVKSYKPSDFDFSTVTAAGKTAAEARICDGSSLGKITLDYDGKTSTPAPYVNGKIEVPLPVKPAGFTDNKIVLDTVKSLYQQYFKDEPDPTNPVIWTDRGDLKLSDPYDSTVLQTHIDTYIKDAEDYFPDLNTDVTNHPSTKTNSGTNAISGLTGYDGWNIIDDDFIVPPGNSTGKYIIDASSKSITLQIGTVADNTSSTPGSFKQYSGEFVVYGNKTVNVVVPSNGIDELQIGREAEFAVYDADIGKNPAELRVSGATTPTSSPNINWYVSKDVKKLTFHQHCGTLQGYMIAPHTTFNMDTTPYWNNKIVTGAFDGTSTLNTNGVLHTSQIEGVCFMGSVFCRNFESTARMIGVCYIPNGNSTPIDNAGKPLYDWTGIWATID
ncbi:MAG: hypothetical protein K6G68_02825 [Oscillospiraceae bacterium]|nr:hypothetical protein [Oscillospiraceae bacterium]